MCMAKMVTFDRRTRGCEPTSRLHPSPNSSGQNLDIFLLGWLLGISILLLASGNVKGEKFISVAQLGNEIQLSGWRTETGCNQLDVALSAKNVHSLDLTLEFNVAIPIGAMISILTTGSWLGANTATLPAFSLIDSKHLRIRWQLGLNEMATGNGLIFSIIICRVDRMFSEGNRVSMVEGGVMVVDVDAKMNAAVTDPFTIHSAMVLSGENRTLSLPTSSVGQVAKVEVVNMQGVVTELPLMQIGETTTIDLRELPAGWFVLKLISAHSIIVRKVLVI